MSMTKFLLWLLGLLVVTFVTPLFVRGMRRKVLWDVLSSGYIAVSVIVSFGAMFVTAAATGGLPLVSRYVMSSHLYSFSTEPAGFIIALMVDIATFIFLLTVCWLVCKKSFSERKTR